MKITDLTPDLARKMCNAYLESLIDTGVTRMNSQQQAICNGLHAIEHLESAKSFITYNRVAFLEDMLAESEQELSAYLNNFSL